MCVYYKRMPGSKRSPKAAPKGKKQCGGSQASDFLTNGLTDASFYRMSSVLPHEAAAAAPAPSAAAVMRGGNANANGFVAVNPYAQIYPDFTPLDLQKGGKKPKGKAAAKKPKSKPAAKKPSAAQKK